ncbi:MAG TPA: hypothetical protein VIQ30_02115 [Pseudonocardia sp.]
MTTDADFIAQRRFADERTYLLKATDLETAPRLAPGMRALRECLVTQKRPVAWTTALAAALRPNDLAVKTMDNMIRKLIAHGFVIKTGDYSRTYNRKARTWRVVDTRKLTLGDWPPLE